MRIAMLLPALALGACSSGQPSNNSAATPAQSNGGYALRSNVAGASLVRVAELPSVTSLPRDSNPDDYCEERYVRPASPGGKLAAQRGWRVRQEERFHQLEAVLIVRGLEQLTSGRCRGVDANVAFFEGERLIGILYPKGKDGMRIDSLEPVNGHLRIWSEDPAAEGQVDLDGARLHFDRVTGSDPVCNGRYRVPAVFGLRYSEARRSLAASGWTAVPNGEVAEGDYGVGDYRKRFPEADSCAGTGYAECRFSLRAKDGSAWLSIVTLGEDDDPIVSDYAASCEPKRPET